MALRLTFIGPPGSGKGTQAKLLKEDGFLHVSSGDMLRAEIASGTSLGRSLADTVASGALVDDAVLFQVLGGFLSHHQDQSIVLDGYPRTLAQARQLAEVGVDAAVFFEIPDAVILRRLGDRVIGPDGTIYDMQLYPPPPGLKVTRRADDDPAVHLTRLSAYRTQESQLRDFYERAGLARFIRAELPLPEVRAQVQALVKSMTAEEETAAKPRS